MNFSTLKCSLCSSDFYLSLYQSLIRGFALFIGLFCLLGLFSSMPSGSSENLFSLNRWWIDLRILPNWMGIIWLTSIGLLLVFYSIKPFTSRVHWKIFCFMIVVCQAILLFNSSTFFKLWHQGSIKTNFPFPFTLIVFIGMGALLISALKEKPTRANQDSSNHRPTQPYRLAMGFCVFALLFPVLQMTLFGMTDYRRPADSIVVFGARTYADGSLSTALADRMRTACELYHQGYAKILIVSGGPGDGEIHETEAMRNFALRQGIPANSILMDPSGLNTQATVSATRMIFQHMKMKRIMAVSHFYHLPRIKMTFQNQGLNVFTVPAEEKNTLRKLPYYILREVAAFWVYWFRGL